MKLFLISILATTFCFAEEVGYTNTPIIPDSGYHVHGPERPHPEKVTQTKTAEIPAPSDAIVLFDGTNLDAWNGGWQVQDGVMVASPKKDIQTKQSFGKIQLHLEFRIDKDRKVKGQKGANSGVFLMGLFEIQIQESHTNKTYADGQAGSMYGQYPPLVNPASPQGEWQSYDIMFEPPVYQDGKLKSPAIATVLHNGVVIHHAQAFMGVSTFRKVAKYPNSLPEKGPIRLQWHQDPVQFRNIWVRDLGEYSVKK